jgi:hypothetical protein
MTSARMYAMVGRISRGILHRSSLVLVDTGQRHANKKAGSVGARRIRHVNAATSARVSSLHFPIGSLPMVIGPTLTRTSFKTFASSASTIRRTCRLRPSVNVISKWVYFGNRGLA